MSQFTSLFIDETAPTVKRTFIVNESDYEAVKAAFPEIGFLAYFPGFIFKVLAEELKHHDIRDFSDRFQSEQLATVPGTLSNLRTAIRSACRDERRGTREVRDGASSGNRVVPITQQSLEEGPDEIELEKGDC